MDPHLAPLFVMSIDGTCSAQRGSKCAIVRTRSTSANDRLAKIIYNELCVRYVFPTGAQPRLHEYF